MGDQNQGAGIALQPFFQPDHRIEIQVVGRFIEQQQIRAANQCLCQVQAHPPAPGEGPYRGVQLFL